MTGQQGALRVEARAGAESGEIVLVDTHAHLDDPRFDPDRDEVLARAAAAGVQAVITVASNLASARRCIALAEAYPRVFATVGIHPHEAGGAGEDDLLQLEELARHRRVVAVGEIGLDYYYQHAPRPVQRDLFVRQLDLALRLDLPVIIHDRDAHDDVLSLVEAAWQPGRLRGVFHAFTGDADMARRCLELGFYLSTGGMITFRNADPVRQVMGEVPLDRILLETDAPYLSPEPFRGRRNEPARVRVVAERLAALRGLTFVEVASQTSANAARLFSIHLFG